MIRESQLMLPNRNATRLKLKKPIRPQFMAPTTAMVRVKYCRHLFDISHHPFVIQEIVFHGIEKIYTGMRKRKTEISASHEKIMEEKFPFPFHMQDKM
jgi:hypothetical protein